MIVLRTNVSIFTMSICCCLASTLFAQQSFQQERVRNPELRDVLLQRMDLDQQARAQMLQSIQQSLNKTPDPELVREMKVVDQANREWLSKYLIDHDWPGQSEVGEDGAHAAWILVQHSDADPGFQRRCLNMMRNANVGEVSSTDIAYLTDRILIGAGKSQIYGTQLQMNAGDFRVAPVHEPEKLNARRETLGLGTIESYLDAVRTNYLARSNAANSNRTR